MTLRTKRRAARRTPRPIVPGSLIRPMPATIEPQLASNAEIVPVGAGWTFEVKFDGYRLLARIRDGKAKLITRGGLDWSGRFPEITAALGDLPVDEAWLDGEAVAVDSEGAISFSALQDALSRKATAGLVFHTFDLLYLDGRDLRPAPLTDRKAALQRVMKGVRSPRVQYVHHAEGDGPQLLDAACRQGLEGIIAKRAADPYRSGRAKSWLKLKCIKGGEFVVGGWSDPQGTRLGFGSLLLGRYDAKGNLIYQGRVGTGFGERLLESLRKRLGGMAIKEMPFVSVPRPHRKGAHWVRPELVVEVAFTEMTTDQQLRHARFKGIREDKPPQAVMVE